ncbi:MAG: family 10 glycosylhydrolase, partial [Oscillospiraceae bacterium]|nr:family 10 glycosylhydrolase [Oscillospiraceae bacterium]
MEPKIAMPLYKWFIIAALILLLGIITLLAVALLSQISTETVSYVDEHSYNLSVPGASDSPTKRLRDPNAEVRGVWIATVDNINFPSVPGLSAEELKAELDDIVDTVNKNGLNAIYFQVRPAADAFYDSGIFPVSKYLTGTQGLPFPNGFDPLAYLIQIAHAEDIYVHAWVNPLRVTSGSAENPNHDLSKLALRNPARLHPEWTIPYADGKLYFDAGIPEVRNLIASGVAEIARNYNVDGIVFDDYFYPYPVTGAMFDDENTYNLYKGEFTNKDDWRRENVNLMVKACYDAIKNVRGNCKFGIAPFGIWQNDNGTNGGSDTKGLNSYSEIYCDPLSWIRGGYIDYIAPQIYWAFNSSAARFDILVKWWNKQLEGYENVDLLICHAMYRSAEWNIANEIRNQIEFARSERSYTGSILYGYAALKRNEMDLEKQLQDAFKYDYTYTSIESNETEFHVSSPSNGSYLNLGSTYLIGRSDPGYPLYFAGKPVSRTKGGYFSLYVNLKYGENKFVFEHKDEEIEYIVNRGVKPAGQTVYQTMDEFKIQSFKPVNDYIVPGGTVIEVTVVAPSKSTVKAKLRNEEITLRATINPPDNEIYMCETYTGRFVVPSWAGEGEISGLGNITFTAVRGGETAAATGVNVRIAGRNAFVVVEVVKDDTELKVSETSWYYDDYTPAQKGMRDEAVSLQNGFYKLRMGGYLRASGVKEIERKRLDVAKISGAYMTANTKETVFYIEAGENVPC